MSLVRSRSLPGVGLTHGIDEDSSNNQGGQGRDSGVLMGSEPPSYGSDLRSSLLGELQSGGQISEPNSSGCQERSKRGSAPKEDDAKKATISRHYYPEGGWGWVVLFVCIFVNCIVHGLHQAWGTMLIFLIRTFPKEASVLSNCWLGALTTSIAFVVSPLTMALCKKKSTRLMAVMGGLTTALGCLFSSFVSEYHQLFCSYGLVVGAGVGITRDSSTVMVGQYFKRKREFVEIFVVSGSGIGISVVSAFVQGAVGEVGWRLGFQAVTGAVFLTFILGTFYRSASLYHPQRRAILHLKNQKRKIKEKTKPDERLCDKCPNFFELHTLKSRTIQILLVSTSLSSFGITTPIIYLAHQAEQEGLGDSTILLLQTYLGLGWVTGCFVFGFLVVQNSTECRVGRQYLCQAAMFLCGVSTLAFTAVEGYHGYVLFAWLFGIFSGGYHYTLKMFTLEKVRPRNFARTWGYVQFSQAIPTAFGIPITGYINVGYGNKAGYYFSSTLIIFGSMTIFLIDIHRRHQARRKHKKRHGHHNCQDVKSRRNSLNQIDPEAFAPQLALIHQRSIGGAEIGVDGRAKPELTCISEEGIADMDLPDHLLEELEYMGDCITSCDKVENFLMMSEYENNLVKTGDLSFLDRKNRKRLFRSGSSVGAGQDTITTTATINGGISNSRGEPALHRKDSLIEAQTGESLIPSAYAPAATIPLQLSGLNASNASSSSTQQNVTFPNQKLNLRSSTFQTIPIIEEASV